MRKLLYLICLSSIILCFSNCINSESKNTFDRSKFTDNGNTMDSLQMTYKSEFITFEEKTIDSSFTVFLINSSIIPTIKGNTDKHNTFKTIASTIKKSLAKPEVYKTYTITFINTKNSLTEVISNKEI